MGNCTGTSRKRAKLHKHSVSRCEDSIVNCASYGDRDTQFDGSIRSKNNEEMNRQNGDFPSKIPVLRNSCTNNNPSSFFKNGDKSVTFERSQSSRIPVTQISRDFRRSEPIFIRENGLLVTTPRLKQMNSLKKTHNTFMFDEADVGARRSKRGDKSRNNVKGNITKVTNQYVTKTKPDFETIKDRIPKRDGKVIPRNGHESFPHHVTKIESKPIQEGFPVSSVEPVDKNGVRIDSKCVQESLSLIVLKNVSKIDSNIVKTCDQENVHDTIGAIRSRTTPINRLSTKSSARLRRPQSLSSESETLINRSMFKPPTDKSDIIPPPVIIHDYSTVIQDVSSLKLMLHKLKRYLAQDGDDSLLDITNDCLFRLSSIPPIDVKSLPREDLEQKYELLVDQNVNLERLLESRESVIVKLQSEKRIYDGIVQSSIGDKQPNLRVPGSRT